jgi:hypothetical protein
LHIAKQFSLMVLQSSSQAGLLPVGVAAAADCIAANDTPPPEGTTLYPKV